MGNAHRYIQNPVTGKLEGRIQISDNRDNITSSSKGQKKIDYIQDPETGQMKGSRKSSDNSTNASKGQKGSSKSASDNTTTYPLLRGYKPPLLGMPAVRIPGGGTR
ncbi:MAG: hypothetical protein H7844_03700 [Nitrospirae bacterium YQR-1]